jgi:SAM-dependent methyltransferase
MSPEAYIEMAETEARHWWFRGRRMLFQSLISKFNLPAGARILEIGSGTGGNLEMLSTFGTVCAVEMDTTARAIAEKKTGGQFDIRPGVCPSDIPFSGEKFDLICLFDVLEHIEEDEKTLVMVKGLLAKGGWALITVPAYQFLWGVHDRFLYHKRRYSSAELDRKISDAGLQVEKLSYFNTFLFPLAVVARLKNRLFKNISSSGTKIPPFPINSLFRRIFSAERFWLGRHNFPFGISLLCAIKSRQNSPDQRNQ